MQYSRKRAKRKGWVNTITKEEVKYLWDRDKADKLKAPSIDRIDSSKGYLFENCRFIERSENSRLGMIGRPTTEKQRVAARKNLSGWVKNNPPWNKGNKPAKKDCAYCGITFQPIRRERVMCSSSCTGKNASRAKARNNN